MSVAQSSSSPGNFIAQLKLAAAAGILAGGRPYTRNFWYTGSSAPVFGRRVDTIKDALAIMRDGDVLLLGPQTYDEGDLVINTDNLTIIGTGNYGKASITPSINTKNGISIKSNFVTLINLDVAGGSAAAYSVKAGYATSLSLNGFRAYQCKFENAPIALHLHGMSDVLIEDCEISWSTNGLRLQANSHGLATEVYVRKCRFHNITTDAVGQSANQAETADFELQDSIFDNDEAGTAPTHYVNLQHNGNTGIITGNRFAEATNAIGKAVIGTGLKWVTNATEAGWSTARPV